MSSEETVVSSFDELGLPEALVASVKEIGYETPSPIQAASIPVLLKGESLLGQAQTGTGKTASFALPLLSRIDVRQNSPQVLVLTPTRELAIQVAEAFQRYARDMRGFHVLPIYGGHSMTLQLKQLRRGPQVIVGTPGRVMDHLRRGTLDTSTMKAVVLDEADEMLKMGFIDDVDWILEQVPQPRQVALFSATMPNEIRKVARRHLDGAQEISIAAKTSTVDTINQRYWQVSGVNKMDALTRIMETENFDAAIIFVRTKNATVELAEKLEARGYSASALNGDMNQALRERTVNQLKNRKLDIVIATDVAARGLDVERITHVINYDIPYDTEAYVHRIGRTGRAGRIGDAILFVTPRERGMLRAIERATRQRIERMDLPTREMVADQRVKQFKDSVVEMSAAVGADMDFFRKLIQQLTEENEISLEDIAATLAWKVQEKRPLILPPEPERPPRERNERRDRNDRNERGGERGERRPRRERPTDVDFVRYRIEVGRSDGLQPGDVVGAIANEAGIESKYIGNIRLYDQFSTVELPDGMPSDVLNHLQKTRVRQVAMNISVDKGPAPKDEPRGDRPPRRPRNDRPRGENRGGRPRRNDAPRKPRSDES
ncbi:DEAD/DEAH box helicase [Oceanospirillum linum]|uniref:ATP-dependent RNA helicase DeaD n=1 Tax=Oceanospirillum linum TaxID=966 RepID=A0A1T1HBY8_OCELI|nr:DEAD/DEAH box helicase [Oceanospirillum linum]OOV87361.1 ATP-dependent RNA helicase [Oceanospirillum linum]SEF82702.1 ATP-dependent RNA helicase CsdA [Oleiphilus messinensis]SMP19466.1 ATP-dependent RNA helicase CsdA [Oceanospirillum linum]